MMRTADLFVKLGLKDLGYLYVGMDACWMQKGVRSNATDQQLVNLDKFPGGFNESIGHIHKLGLKAGICARAAWPCCASRAVSAVLVACADTAAATSTCGGGSPTGSCKHEVLDARTYAQWGIDCTHPVCRLVSLC